MTNGPWDHSSAGPHPLQILHCAVHTNIHVASSLHTHVCNTKSHWPWEVCALLCETQNGDVGFSFLWEVRKLALLFYTYFITFWMVQTIQMTVQTNLELLKPFNVFIVEAQKYWHGAFYIWSRDSKDTMLLVQTLWILMGYSAKMLFLQCHTYESAVSLVLVLR